MMALEHKKDHIDTHERGLESQRKTAEEKMPEFICVRQAIEFHEDLRNAERRKLEKEEKTHSSQALAADNI